MKRIGIAVLMETIGGPRTYGYNLLKSLSSIDNENRYLVFTDNIDSFNNLGVEPVLVRLESLYALLLWDYLKLPYYITKHKIDIFHHTKNIVPLFTSRISVVTIHDLAPFIFPETFPIHHRIYLQRNMLRVSTHAERIITVSQNSKKDIINILKVDEKKIDVVYNGISDRFREIKDSGLISGVRDKYNLWDKIILYVGTIQPRKNVDILIKVFHSLKRENKIEHKLVIVGREGWLSKPMHLLIRELNLEGEVFLAGSIPDEELPIFYNMADIFVYLSSYEGFGLSILEAMACCTPVIASNISSIPEVVGDSGILVNPKDLNEIKEAIIRLISDRNLHNYYCQKGIERAGHFSWDRSAKEVIKVYNKL
ncbi:MAG: glycosyltransferase family 4 protein [Nitrospirota bacterium]